MSDGATIIDEEAAGKAIRTTFADPLVRDILNKLQDGLSRSLTYHSFEHTVEVIRDVVTYAVMEGLSAREVELLGIGAAYHDAGYLHSPDEHEERGASMAGDSMQMIGKFTSEEVAAVKRMINATKWYSLGDPSEKIAPEGLSRFLVDADVSNLGRDDFFEKSELLSKEVGMPIDEFFRRSYQFASSHHWFTLAAFTLRQPMKEVNLSLLEQRLRVLE
jgi:uncharacterized protein